MSNNFLTTPSFQGVDDPAKKSEVVETPKNKSKIRAIKVAYTTDATGYLFLTSDESIMAGDVVVVPTDIDLAHKFSERGHDFIRVAKVMEVDVQHYVDFNDRNVEYRWIFNKLDITITEKPSDQKKKIAKQTEEKMKLGWQGYD